MEKRVLGHSQNFCLSSFAVLTGFCPDDQAHATTAAAAASNGSSPTTPAAAHSGQLPETLLVPLALSTLKTVVDPFITWNTIAAETKQLLSLSDHCHWRGHQSKRSSTQPPDVYLRSADVPNQLSSST